MKVLVVDDEALARQRIVKLLQNVNNVQLIGECANGKSAIVEINNKKPDLLFLDISMKDMNGFQVLKNIEINPKPIVVFVTAYDTYATKAFDVDAFDFLLKPFRDERFFKTINKVQNISTKEAQKNFQQHFKKLFNLYVGQNPLNNMKIKLPVRQGNKTVLLAPQEINYICASGYYAEIFSDGKKYVLRESLQHLDEYLDHSFFRIHRSTIVNLNHITEIVHSNYAEADVRMNDGKLLRISKSHKKDLFKKLGIE